MTELGDREVAFANASSEAIGPGTNTPYRFGAVTISASVYEYIFFAPVGVVHNLIGYEKGCPVADRIKVFNVPCTSAQKPDEQAMTRILEERFAAGVPNRLLPFIHRIQEDGAPWHG